MEIAQLTGWSQGFDEQLVARYEGAGADRLVVTPWTSSRTALRGMGQFATEAGLS